MCISQFNLVPIKAYVKEKQTLSSVSYNWLRTLLYNSGLPTKIDLIDLLHYYMKPLSPFCILAFTAYEVSHTNKLLKIS